MNIKTWKIRRDDRGRTCFINVNQILHARIWNYKNNDRKDKFSVSICFGGGEFQEELSWHDFGSEESATEWLMDLLFRDESA